MGEGAGKLRACNTWAPWNSASLRTSRIRYGRSYVAMCTSVRSHTHARTHARTPIPDGPLLTLDDTPPTQRLYDAICKGAKGESGMGNRDTTWHTATQETPHPPLPSGEYGAGGGGQRIEPQRTR